MEHYSGEKILCLFVEHFAECFFLSFAVSPKIFNVFLTSLLAKLFNTAS